MCSPNRETGPFGAGNGGHSRVVAGHQSELERQERGHGVRNTHCYLRVFSMGLQLPTIRRGPLNCRGFSYRLPPIEHSQALFGPLPIDGS